MNNLVDIGKIKVMMTLGQAGTSIASIEKTSTSTSTDYYTITLTDGSTTQLSIEKGVGIVSIEKTSTEGLVDTYTITLTNGDTTTFEVINGQSYTVPTDGVLYYEGNTVPEGFEQTTPPAGQAVEIDDSAPSPYKVYSSQKTTDAFGVSIVSPSDFITLNTGYSINGNSVIAQIGKIIVAHLVIEKTSNFLTSQNIVGNLKSSFHLKKNYQSYGVLSSNVYTKTNNTGYFFIDRAQNNDQVEVWANTAGYSVFEANIVAELN